MSITLKVGLGAVLAGGVLAPDLLLGLLLESLHASFEVLEFSLDLLVEHIFHTDRHSTQVIVFYLLLSLLVVLIYWLIRHLPTWYCNSKNGVIETWIQRNTAIKDTLRTMSLWNKTKWCLGLTMGFGVLMLGLFS